MPNLIKLLQAPRQREGSQLQTLVPKLFADYYKKKNNSLYPPTSIQKREFGFILLERRVMIRHKSFKDFKGLKSFLASTALSDAYYSAAYYEQPEAEMDKKNWLGADLVFDIDADHIPTPCGKVHDSWTCSNCSFAGRGPSPERCPNCGKEKFDSKAWMCNDCLESAKEETIKLVDMLNDDFGFADNEIRIYFSGNRGYHVHVESENVRLLDSVARKEIVDYIIGLGFKAELHKLMDKGRVIIGHELVGWSGRIAKGLHQFLSKTTSDELETVGLKKNKTKLLVENKKQLLDHWNNEGWLGVKGVGSKNWKRIIQWVVGQQSAKIDTVVTTDIHRLIRLPGSLHGKTGFMKMEAPLSGFEEFDPLKEAVAFKEGQVVVDIVEAPEFRIGETPYGPFKNVSHVELPTAAALFLVCKGAAEVVNTNV